MVTVILAGLGIFFYVLVFKADGWGYFTGNYIALLCWVLAIGTTIRYFTSDDEDETLPKIAMILIDILAGADMCVRGALWAFHYVYIDGSLNLLHCCILVLPILATVVFVCSFSPNDTDPDANAFTMREKCRLVSFGLNLVLTFTLLFMNPAYNPESSGTYVFGTGIFHTLTGASLDVPPQPLDVSTWSWRMRIAGIAIIVLFLAGIFVNMKRSRERFIPILFRSITGHILIVYGLILFMLVRKNVLLPYGGIIYFFAELALLVIVGISLYALPFALLLPETFKEVNRTIGTGGSVLPSEEYIQQKDEEFLGNIDAQRQMASKVAQLPDTIYDKTYGKAYHLVFKHYAEASYKSDDGDYVTLRSESDINQYRWW